MNSYPRIEDYFPSGVLSPPQVYWDEYLDPVKYSKPNNNALADLDLTTIELYISYIEAYMGAIENRAEENHGSAKKLEPDYWTQEKFHKQFIMTKRSYRLAHMELQALQNVYVERILINEQK